MVGGAVTRKDEMSNVTDDATKPIDELRLPDPITATDRLRLLYSKPGPYTSVYLATRPLLPDSEGDITRRWETLRRDLETQCAEPEVLRAIDARLALPTPDDAAAIGVLAAADATTVVDYGLEPPRVDVATVDVLPYAAPLLEWDQRRVPHLVVTIDSRGADIATFGPDRFSRLDTIEGGADLITEAIETLAETTHTQLIVLAGDPPLARLVAEQLVVSVPVDCRIVAEPEAKTVDDLADATVRHVSDSAARVTVGYLRELRYLVSHQSAVDGTADTIAALRARAADVLLIHDDPDDQRRVWIGTEPHQLSLESRTGYDQHARLVDAAIRAAITTGAKVHIIPTTGPRGPEDDAAALYRSAPTGEISG